MTAGDAYLYREEKSRNGEENPFRDFLREKTWEKKTAYLVIKKLGSENEK